MPAARRLVPRPLVVVLAAALLAGCGVDTGTGSTLGSGKPPGGNPDVVIGATPTTATTAPTTTTTLPPTPDVDVEGMKDTPENDTVTNAIVDLEAWWADEFPRVYGEPYEPLSGGLFAVDSGTDPRSIPCAPDDIDQVLENAYYCPPADAVIWDQERLMPFLAKTYGAFTPAIAIAHEWGHAVQERARFVAPTVISEQQADCFAGAWVKHERTDDDARFEVSVDDLDKALAGLLFLRDAPGSTADDPNAHGSGFDRVRAFQEGFEDGADRCAEYRVGDPKPFQFPFTSQTDFDNNGDLPLHGTSADDPGVEELTFASLDAYWADVFPSLSDGEAWDPMDDPVAFTPDDPPSCGGKEVTGYLLFVCIPDRYVGYDDETTIPGLYDQYGDFAVAVLFATQYGLDVEDQLGITSDDDVVTTLRGDCFAGAWAAAIIPPDVPEGYQMLLSPGDLDEAVGTLLSFRSDADRKRQGPGFARVKAFSRGVLRGPKACTTLEAD